jgi:hypothetical protein
MLSWRLATVEPQHPQKDEAVHFAAWNGIKDDVPLLGVEAAGCF